VSLITALRLKLVEEIAQRRIVIWEPACLESANAMQDGHAIIAMSLWVLRTRAPSMSLFRKEERLAITTLSVDLLRRLENARVESVPAKRTLPAPAAMPDLGQLATALEMIVKLVAADASLATIVENSRDHA
jgi:hypothetical protein